MTAIDQIHNQIKELRHQLRTHELYSNLQTIDDVKIFMEYHVYAVWDFMSLIKQLQIDLTCVSTPWIPVKNPIVARFVNEIVHGEETDIDLNGQPMSHFEMYLDAMQEVGASTTAIDLFIEQLQQGATVQQVIQASDLPQAIKKFMTYTFDIIAQHKTHQTASCFTFGREDVIPDMFLSIIEQSNTNGKTYDKLRYYLQRHIELDGDEHGPLALKMIAELCQQDEQKWQEVTTTAITSLEHRVQLWDAINHAIMTSKTTVIV